MADFEAYVVHLNENGIKQFYNNENNLNAKKLFEFYQETTNNGKEVSDIFDVSSPDVLTDDRHFLESPIAAIVLDEDENHMFTMVELPDQETINLNVPNTLSAKEKIAKTTKILGAFGLAAQELNMGGISITFAKNSASFDPLKNSGVFVPIKTPDKTEGVFRLPVGETTYKY